MSTQAHDVAGDRLLPVARRLAAATEQLQSAAGVLAESAATLTAADGACVATLVGSVLHVDAATGSLAPLLERWIPVGESLVARALDARETVSATLLDAALPLLPGTVAVGLPVRHALVTQLEAGGAPFGIIVTARSSDPAFADEQVTLLRRISDLGSLAVRNALLLERERRSAREARALGEIVQHLNQSLELERVVALIAEYAADLLGARGAVVSTLDGTELHVTGAAGDARPLGARTLSLEGSLSGEVVRLRRPVRTADVRTESRWRETATIVGTGSANALAAPLLVGDRPTGAVVVYGNDRRDFTEHDEELLRVLASHAAIAMENARLYRAAAHTTRHAHILAVTARTLAASVAPDKVFDGIAEVVTSLLGADGFSIYAVDVPRRSVTLTHSSGVGAGFAAGLSADAFWRELPGQVIAKGVELLLGDLAGDARRAGSLSLQALLDAGVQGLALLPLVVEGQTRGVLSIRYRRRRQFDDAEHELLRDFATQVAIALRNTDLIVALERRALRLAAVAQVQQAMARTGLDEVYAEVHRAVSSSVRDADVFALLLANDDRTLFTPQLIVVDGVSTAASALPGVPLTACAASRAFTTAAPVTTRAPERGWAQYVAGFSSRTATRSEIAVPLLHGDGPRGVIIVQSYAPEAFDDDDVDVLALIGRQAANAIETARIFEAERREREIAQSSAAVARAALGSVAIPQTAREILDAIDTVVPSAGKALALATDDGDSMTYVAASGVLEELRGFVIPGAQSAVRLVAGRVEPLVPTTEALAGIREGTVIRAGACLVPLIAKNRVLGLLWSVPVAGARQRAADRETLGRLAAPVALAADVLLLGEGERTRRERERMLATALATMDQPVFVLGLDRRVWYANAAAVREYGYTLEELTDLSLDALVASAVPARRLGMGLPTATSSVWLAEHVHRRRDGSSFPASVMLSYIRDDVGAPVGQVLNVRNLTEERRLEEQLRQSEKLAALGELVAGVAHELNNPLAGISALAQLLLEDQLSDEQRDSVRLVKREADRAVGVIRDLLIFSRKTGPARAPVDLNEIIELTLRLRSYSLRSAGVDVQLDLERGVPRVHGDDQRLQQVLLNLVVNAEYALQRAASKRLIVTTALAEGGLTVMVRDTGVGMDEETRQRIFEPFYTTKPAGQGTGLGLSVSYGIVHAHGGTITVASEPGRGTTFRVFLPAQPGDADTVRHA